MSMSVEGWKTLRAAMIIVGVICSIPIVYFVVVIVTDTQDPDLPRGPAGILYLYLLYAVVILGPVAVGCLTIATITHRKIRNKPRSSPRN